MVDGALQRSAANAAAEQRHANRDDGDAAAVANPGPLSGLESKLIKTVSYRGEGIAALLQTLHTLPRPVIVATGHHKSGMCTLLDTLTGISVLSRGKDSGGSKVRVRVVVDHDVTNHPPKIRVVPIAPGSPFSHDFTKNCV